MTSRNQFLDHHLVRRTPTPAKVEDNDQGQIWPSIDALLEEVVASLEHGHPCRGWVPTIEEGWLHWEFS